MCRHKPDGALFWKISSGNAHEGMPAFSFLPELQRWQLVLQLRGVCDGSVLIALIRIPAMAPSIPDCSTLKMRYTESRAESESSVRCSPVVSGTRQKTTTSTQRRFGFVSGAQVASHHSFPMSDRNDEWRRIVQPLSGSLVTVREVVTTDAATLPEALTDPLVTTHISAPPPSIRAFEGFIAWAQRERALGNGVAFGIVPTGLEHAVGIIQVRALDATFFAAEWGFVLARSFWSTGIFQDAARLAVSFAFETLKVHRLEARAVSQNRRGNGALLKLGAGAEAVLAKAFKRGPHYDEQLLWSLIATEWQANAGVSGSRFVPAEVRTLVRKALTKIQRQLQESRLSASMEQAPPPLYPFFVTGNPMTTRVCPTCGGIISSARCPKC